jgi:hypothetical protein
MLVTNVKISLEGGSLRQIVVKAADAADSMAVEAAEGAAGVHMVENMNLRMVGFMV